MTMTEETFKTTIELPTAMHKHLKRLAVNSDMTIKEIVIQALKNFIYKEVKLNDE